MAILLLTPAALAQTPPPLLPGDDTGPRVHANANTIEYADEVARAFNFSTRYQRADGGVYEYAQFGALSDSIEALRFWARLPTLDAQGTRFTALLGYIRANQNPDGSWGSPNVRPINTATIVDGLNDAGIDPESEMMWKAYLYIELNQNAEGYWEDGVNAATYLTALNVKNLLAKGVPKDDARIQAAVEWVLAHQRGADAGPEEGGYPPSPDWFVTPAATAEVLEGLEAYLQAPVSGDERVADETVEASIARTITYFERSFDNRSRTWQAHYSIDCTVLDRLVPHFQVREQPLPAWAKAATAAVLENQTASGGFPSWGGTPFYVYTARCGRALLGYARDFAWQDALPLQITLNNQGAYLNGTATVTLRDETGRLWASATVPTGFATLPWKRIPGGVYTLTVAAPGAVGHDVLIPLSHGDIPAPPPVPPVFEPRANVTGAEGAALAFDVAATHPDGEAITLALLGKPANATFTATGGLGTFAWTPEAGSRGVHTLTFHATSEFGGEAYQNLTLTVGPGTRAPVTSFSLPSFLRVGANVTFTDASQDPDGGAIVARAWSFGDGATATGSPAFHTYTAEGRYNVTLTVTDDDGATATATRSVLADGTAPVATAALDGTRSGDVYRGPVTVALGAIDPHAGSGLLAIRYRLDGGGVSSSPSNLSLTVDRSGTHTLEYWAVDRAGNAGPPQNVTFTLDADAPGVTILSPGDLSTTRRVTLSAEATEAESPSSVKVTYFVDDQPVATFHGAGTHSVTRTIGAGQHVFRVEARDAAGNVAVAETEFLVVWLT